MMHRRAFEATDRTLRDLMQLDDAQATKKVFGGKTVVLGGDFRQILLVVPKGDEKTLSVLPCFDRIFGNMLQFFVFILTCESWQPILKSSEFAKWVLNVGDGSLPTIAEEEGVDLD
jgi:hypothetical protein